MNTFQQTLWPHRLPLLAVVYCLGILAETNHLLPLRATILFTVLGITSALLILRRGTIAGFATSLFIVFLLGGSAARFSAIPPQDPEHISTIIKEPKEVILIGNLDTMPLFDGTTATAIIDLVSLGLPTSKEIIKAKGKVLLRMHFPWPDEYLPGARLAIRATVKRPHRTMTPGAFDYPSFLAAQDIWITGYVRSPQLLLEIERPPSFFETLVHLPEKTRNTIGHFIDKALAAQNNTGIYRALLIGDRSQIPKAVEENYRASGLAHLLCISGMHLSLIGLLLAGVFFLLLRQSEYITLLVPIKKTALLLSLPFLVVYTFLAGLNPAAIRACLMAATVCLIFCNNRPRSGMTMIAAAALLILFFSPQALFNPSLQLSFAAIVAIFLVSPDLTRILFSNHSKQRLTATLSAVPRWITASLVVSFAATLGTAPLVISHFHRLPLLGPFTNLVVEPLLCFWALPWGFLALLILPGAPELSATLLTIGHIAIDQANKIAAFSAAIPQSCIWLPKPPTLLIIAYYATFLLFFAPLRYRLLRFCVFALSAAILLVPNFSRPWHLPESPTITFIDVGQGSATLIELPSGENILIDGGASSYGISTVGERILAPFLWHKGITTLEAIIITHPDSDHYNGVPFLIEHFTPKLLWTSTVNSGEPSYQQLLALCNTQHVQVFLTKSDDHLQYGQTTISCISNCLQERNGKRNSNDGLVLLMESQGTTILFPGDIEKDTETELVAKKLLTPVDLLVAAHHGSQTSNSQAFLEATTPQAIIVSAAQSKKQRYPSPALRNYSLTNSIPLYTTHSNGSLILTIDKNMALLTQVSDWQDQPLQRKKSEAIPLQELQKYGFRKENRTTPR